MNEYSYRALTQYKQESIKKEYQAANRKRTDEKKEDFKWIKILLAITSKKRTESKQQPCCKVQCC